MSRSGRTLATTCAACAWLVLATMAPLPSARAQGNAPAPAEHVRASRTNARARGIDRVALAETAYDHVDFEKTRKLASEALEAGGSDGPRLWRIYSLIAASSAALREADKARDAYCKLLALNPGFRLGPDVSPILRDAYLAAARSQRADAVRLGAEVRPSAADGSIFIRLTDPIAMASAVLFTVRAAPAAPPMQWRAKAASGIKVLAAYSPSTTRIFYHLEVFDAHKNRIYEIGTRERPEPLVIAHPGPAGAASF